MSRSYRKTPIFGNSTSKSDKPGKKTDNRRYRHYMNQKLRQGEEEIEHLFLKTNPWSWPKDGKHYWAKALTDKKWMRK